MTPSQPMIASAETEDKAKFLAELAGVDDVPRFLEKAQKTSWRDLAMSAKSALRATREEVTEAVGSTTGQHTKLLTTVLHSDGTITLRQVGETTWPKVKP